MLISTGGTVRGLINPISAVIHQQINGEYSCQVSIPLSDALAEYFVADAIVYLDDANGTEQQFRLERPERTLDSLVAFGWHITQDLANDIIVDDSWVAEVGSDVWTELLQAGISETRFTGTADTSAVGTLRISRKSVLAAIIDSEDSFISEWGGEIERDNFTVNMKTQLGADRDYRVMYKKNMTGIHVTVDNSTVVNRIVPTYLSSADVVTLLPEIYIDSANIGDTAVPHARAIHYSDIRVGEEVDGVVLYPTTPDAETEVRARVAALYAAGVDVPFLTVEISFIRLRDTLEYADYAALEEVQLGDTIGAVYEDYSWTSRIVAYDWDALLGRYVNLTIGNVRPSVSDMSQSIVDEATAAANSALTERTVELTGAIASAQSTADGKNTVYYSSTEPTGGDYIANDIWYDTDDDNKMYLHDGSVWVPVQYGTNAIADLAITNAKVSNLDAGSITTGQLSAARIDTDTLYVKTIRAASDVTNYIDFDPAYLWGGQTFSAMRFWTDDAAATPADVQHLAIFGDASASGAETLSYITTMSQSDSDSFLDYEQILRVGAMVPFAVGDGAYGYIEFIGNRSDDTGIVSIAASNSDGSDYFNVATEYNEFSIADETSKLLSLTRSGGLVVERTTEIKSPISQIALRVSAGDGSQNPNIVLVRPNAVNDHKGIRFEYNQDDGLRIQAANANGTYRNLMMRIYADTGNTQISGTLSAGKTTLSGDLNMGANDINITGDIEGDTTDTWITARRIGLGTAANSSYTVDAAGYIRGTRIYGAHYSADGDAGESGSVKIYDYTTSSQKQLVFEDGILIGIFNVA